MLRHSSINTTPILKLSAPEFIIYILVIISTHYAVRFTHYCFEQLTQNHTYIRTYIYIHTYVHTYIHT